MEKFSEIVPILDALPRSATAQLLTSYVSIITGPSANTDGSVKELHIILMDNRRTEMAADPKFIGNLVLRHARDIVKPARTRGFVQQCHFAAHGFCRSLCRVGAV